VASQTKNLKVYCHPEAIKPKFASREKTVESIGMSAESKETINGLSSENLHWVSVVEDISETMGITGTIPRLTNYEDAGGRFFIDSEAKIPDPVNDDMSMWFKTEKGIVICTGCCHAGLINTISYIRQHTKESGILAVIGGFHLVNASEQRINMTVNDLKTINPEMLIPCHCTGRNAVEAFQEMYGKRVIPGFAGMMLEF
jgi:7,8-dihydropterin-6-yl-methyl-4-(beta-D-ribofuranosyl)aminobenzene 5'-phosphate synthase